MQLKRPTLNKSKIGFNEAGKKIESLTPSTPRNDSRLNLQQKDGQSNLKRSLPRQNRQNDVRHIVGNAFQHYASYEGLHFILHPSHLYKSFLNKCHESIAPLANWQNVYTYERRDRKTGAADGKSYL